MNRLLNALRAYLRRRPTESGGVNDKSCEYTKEDIQRGMKRASERAYERFFENNFCPTHRREWIFRWYEEFGE